jgi:hypothetical protein
VKFFHDELMAAARTRCSNVTRRRFQLFLSICADLRKFGYLRTSHSFSIPSSKPCVTSRDLRTDARRDREPETPKKMQERAKNELTRGIFSGICRQYERNWEFTVRLTSGRNKRAMLSFSMSHCTHLTLLLGKYVLFYFYRHSSAPSWLARARSLRTRPVSIHLIAA